MTSSLRFLAAAGTAFLLLLVATAITGLTPAVAAEKQDTLKPFFFDFFNGGPPAKEHVEHKHRHKAASHHAAKPKTAAATKIDPAMLRQAVHDTLAHNPEYLRGVIADFVRNDPALRSIIASAIPKPAAAKAAPQTPLPVDRGAIEKIVHDYLMAHPEVLQEAMSELEKRQTAAQAEKYKVAVKEHAQKLFSSPNQVTLGNPNGNVTFVEFFDYNCGYCKRAMDDMLTLLKGDPKLKVVLKEFPVLGPGSLEAARVAVAVRMQDKTGKKYLEFHTKLLGGRGAADEAHALAVAKDIGMNMAQIQKDMKGPEVKATLDEDFKLAEALGLNGTPSYVIGADVVVGAIGLPGLQEKINTARCGKPTC